MVFYCSTLHSNEVFAVIFLGSPAVTPSSGDSCYYLDKVINEIEMCEIKKDATFSSSLKA